MNWERRASPCGGFTSAHCGTEVHVEFHRPGVVTKAVLRAFFQPLLDELGFVTTRTQREDTRNARFVQRLGFKKTWADDQYDYYMLTAVPFTKER